MNLLDVVGVEEDKEKKKGIGTERRKEGKGFFKDIILIRTAKTKSVEKMNEWRRNRNSFFFCSFPILVLFVF